MDNITKEYSQTELTEILEIARLALRDADFFDYLVDSCDLSDEYLKNLQEKLNKTMGLGALI